MERVVYKFGPFRLDPSERLLLRKGTPVALTPKAFETLQALVENSGHMMEKDELLRMIWPDSFVEESTLAQNIHQLRRSLAEGSTKEKYIETVQRRGYRFVAKVQLLAAGKSRASKLLKPEKTESGVKSIAVLPFKPLGSSPDDEYLGVGIADALISKLSNVNKLIVRSTDMVLRYNNAEQEPIAAGKDLKVDLVLVGKIHNVNSRIRLTVQLLDVHSGVSMWADKFDGNSTDFFTLQDIISEEALSALTLKLTSDERRLLAKNHTESPEAYRHYLKGRHLWNKWTEEDLRKSLVMFQRAIDIDPNYALAYVGLADAYYALGFNNHLSPHETMPQVKAAAQKAMKINDTLSEAVLSMASVSFYYDWNFTAAEKQFRRAIQLNPNYGIAYLGYGLYLIAMGRFDEAISNIERATEIDPVSPLINTTLGIALYFARRYEDALDACLKTLELHPAFGLAYVALGDIYMQMGKHQMAIDAFKKGLELSGNKANELVSLGHAYAVSGDTQQARRMLEELEKQTEKRYIAPLSYAVLYTGLEEKDKALYWLEEAYQARSLRLVNIYVHPTFDLLRSDQRFKSILDLMGFKRHLPRSAALGSLP